MNNYKNISVWGDSVLLGVLYENNKHSLNKSFAQKVASTLNIDINNFSRFGMTTAKAVKLFSDNTQYDAVVIEYGGNDCNFDWGKVSLAPDKEHLPAVPLNEFYSNIEFMIEKAKADGSAVVVCTLPPLVPDKFFNFITQNGLSKENILHWLGNVGRIYRHQERYNSALVMLAKKHNCMIIDIRDAFLRRKDCNDLLCDDGMHPNITGQGVMLDTFLEFYNNVNINNL